MMRRVLIAWTLSMAITGPLFAQEWARKMFEVTSHDFGTVARGGNAEFAFTFTNLYKEDIHVASVRTSCGCTTPRIVKQTLKTWDKSAVVATLNTSRFQGERSATLTVVIDQPYYAEVQLQVHGHIRGDLLLSPGGIDFGTVDGGQEVSKQLRIQHAGSPAWRINAIKSPSPYLSAEAVEVARTSKQVTYDLTVFLSKEAPEGYVNEALVIETNDRAASRFPIEIEGRVVSELTVSPASLFLGVLKPGEKVTKQVVLKGKKPFRILEVNCPDKCVRCTPSSEARPLHLLPVTFTAGNKPGKVTERITIKTSLGSSTTEVVAYAQITAPPKQPDEPQPEPEPKPQPEKKPEAKPEQPPVARKTPPPSESDDVRPLNPPVEPKQPAESPKTPTKPPQEKPAAEKPDSEVEREADVPLPTEDSDDDAPPSAPPGLLR